MEAASMGEMLRPYSTDLQIQRHIRQARALRAAYIRAALGRLLARALARFARPRAHASAERSPDRDTLRAVIARFRRATQ
jgi:hypothetical protein